MTKVNVFWFRRDIRISDNTALRAALKGDLPVLILFIFDESILDELLMDDPRVNFIYEELHKINESLKSLDSSILVKKGEPILEWKKLISEYEINCVFSNRDYEPYALQRDNEIKLFLKESGIQWQDFKDQVIYEKNDILKKNGEPYTVFTPYKNRWLENFSLVEIEKTNFDNLLKSTNTFPSKEALGVVRNDIKVLPFTLNSTSLYASQRDYPFKNIGSYLGPHLRFGTISIREIIISLEDKSEVFISELIWREFFMQILCHFPKVVSNNFRSKYDGINWRNNQDEFQKWKDGKTGYPLVDAGMRELNKTGYMHNRVRMVTAGFLCKHLLIDWKWGEAYFAEKLLDYELSSNNGNWQWAAGTGCDAAPYFRVFNPKLQLEKFDKNCDYVNKWVPEYGTSLYADPIVEHSFARNRAIETYKTGILS
ncbi:MAG: deoxyribodipyrimidine photo-lyase [Flavobacteriales bacterium]|jgi:deoxyribodipyrimidine photo-lyase|tara:strand:- start:3922 stop:5199 length:1278 start_codon:yes stop_codon:yes gene_type:complete